MMKGIWRGMAVAAALTLLAACGGGDSGGGGGGSTDTDVCGGATLGCLTGVVQDATGAAIGNINVTYEAVVAAAAQTVGKASTALTTTNDQGWFSSTGLPEGNNVICFAKDGYVKKCRRVTITAQENTPLPATKLATRGTAFTVTNVEGGGTATDPSGTAGQIVFPANSVCDSAGGAVTGDIQCYLTPIDVTSEAALETVPDTFVAIATGGAQGTMVSNAMMEITCENASGEVNLCTGKTATVQLPIYGADCATQTDLPGWRFDESTGVWRQYDTGDFVKTCGVDQTDSFYTGNVDHLTWINGDLLVDDACLTGLVYLSEGQLTGSNVTVQCWGSGWRNEVQVGADGRFCVPVPVSRIYTCKVGDSSGWIDAGLQITGTAPAAKVTFPVASCPASGCEETTGFIFASSILTTTLTWGVAPSDLDSHMVGSSVHVYFVDKADELTKGSLVAAPFIALDTDDTDSYGPEVTTVMPAVADGKYCFFIHNYSETPNMGNESTDQNDAAKKATVIAIGEGVSRTFTIPANPNDYLYWRIYTVEFQGGTVVSGSFTAYDDLVSAEPTDCTW